MKADEHIMRSRWGVGEGVEGGAQGVLGQNNVKQEEARKTVSRIGGKLLKSRAFF